MATTYYLWKDKALSTEKNIVVYITDYKKKREDGKTLVHKVGWVDVEEVFSSTIKAECLAFAQKLV